MKQTPTVSRPARLGAFTSAGLLAIALTLTGGSPAQADLIPMSLGGTATLAPASSVSNSSSLIAPSGSLGGSAPAATSTTSQSGLLNGGTSSGSAPAGIANGTSPSNTLGGGTSGSTPSGVTGTSPSGTVGTAPGSVSNGSSLSSSTGSATTGSTQPGTGSSNAGSAGTSGSTEQASKASSGSTCQFNIVPGDLTPLPWQGGTFHATVLATRACAAWTWTAEPVQGSWMTGRGTGRVDMYGMAAIVPFTYPYNPWNASRTTTIWVRVGSGGMYDVELTVQQNPNPTAPRPTLSLSSLSWSAPSNAASSGFTVYTNQSSWKATSNQSWLTLSTASGVNGGYAGVNVSANTSTSPRTAKVTVVAGSLGETYTVTQAGAPKDTLSVTMTNWSAPSYAANGGFYVYTNTTGWSATSDQPWLTMFKYQGRNGDYDYASVTANTSTASRTGTITFRTGSATPVTLTVTQAGVTVPPPNAPATLSLSVASWVSDPAAHTMAAAEVVYTNQSTWTASSNQSWMTFSKYSGTSGDYFYVTITANTSSATRVGTITVKAGTATATATVTQSGVAAPATPTISITSNSWSLPGVGAATAVTVTTNQSSFSVSTSGSWLTASPGSGASGTYVTIQASANPSTSPRTGTVTFHAGSASTTMTVTQVGASAQATVSLGIPSWSAPQAGGLAGFYVYTNQSAWSASSNQSWLAISQATGTTGTWFIVGASANTTGRPRTAVVTFTAGGATATMTVTQAA